MHIIKGEDEDTVHISKEEEEISEWDTGTERELAKHCSFCDIGATITLSDEVLGVITALCERVKDEWQLLLIGEDDGINVKITDYYVPEQEYGAAHVHNKDCVNKKMIEGLGIVAGIHSHSTFEPYFSTTDEVTNNSLIRNHIVVNNKGKFVATKRVDLPCGMKKFVDAKVMRDLPQIEIPKKIKGMKRMKKSTPIIIQPYHFEGGYTKQIGAIGYGTQDSLPGKRKQHAFHIL